MHLKKPMSELGSCLPWLPVFCGVLWVIGRLVGYSGNLDRISISGWLVLGIGLPLLGFALRWLERRRGR